MRVLDSCYRKVACVLLAALVAVLLGIPATAFATDYRYVAHQGKVSNEFRGNTIPAFEKAASCDGIFGIETDIWRTADGQYVCLHGEDTNEPSGGENGATWAGMNVWNTELDQLRAEKVHGHKLPTLDEYLDICRSGGKWAFIEIKNPELAEDPSYAAEVVQIVNDHDMLNQCVFVSWRGRAKAVYYLKQCAINDYGIDALGHIGSGRTNKLVDESIAMAEEYGLDGIGTYPDISQQAYAYERLKGTGLKLRSTGKLKDERHARELIEKYNLWAVYCEFIPTSQEEPEEEPAEEPVEEPAEEAQTSAVERVQLEVVMGIATRCKESLVQWLYAE